MTTLTNNYAEKINSEHPIAFWMLNEQLDYISKITETNRQFETSGQWTITNGSAVSETSTQYFPFPNSHSSTVSGNVPSTTNMDISCTSVFTFPTSSFDLSNSNFSIAGNIYINTSYLQSISYGFTCLNTITGLTEEILVTENLSTYGSSKWFFFSDTFDIPKSYQTNPKILIRFNVLQGGLTTNDYKITINGLSVGQWSEDFNRTSLGVNPSSIPSDISSLSSMYCIPANSYGSTNSTAYYLSNQKTLFAKNFGIPLVFGSSNVSKLYPNNNSSIDYPSLIFPGHGFLNEKGRHNDYTAELWVRINTQTATSRKIFGPINSADGLYVEGGSFTFVLNKQFKSYFIGEWLRPMLIHIRYSNNTITVLLNSEQIISMDYDQNSISLISEYDNSGKNQDWVGIYAYSDVHPVSIDSYAIYSYIVPIEVAKRRFVWGQGVTDPEITNSFLNGKTLTNDYSFSNYAVNYNYPDFASWKQGFSSNLDISNQNLTIPNYSLPTFYLNKKTIDNLYNDIYSITPSLSDSDDTAGYKYFTFRPNSSWNNSICYLLFNNLDILKDKIESFYGIFKSDGSSVNEPLIKIIDKNNDDSFLIKINGNTVTYSITLSGTTTTISTKTITSDQRFSIGLNLSNIINQDIYKVHKFFANPSSLKLYLGGDGTTTFTGKIYSFGFDSSYNNRYINSLYDTSGIFNINLSTANILMNHISNYKLFLNFKYNFCFADIAIAGYWEDYIPLTYLAKYVTDYSGKKYYDLDSLQFNIGIPEPIGTTSVTSTSSWNYQDIYNQYSSPVILSYSDLSNTFYTGWTTYNDLESNSTVYEYHNTNTNSIKSYISFQKISSGSNKSLIDFTNNSQSLANNFLDIDSSLTQWEDTIFEVVDSTIVYPPSQYSTNISTDINDLSMVIHLDFKINGTVNNTINLKNLQIASQVLNRETFTEIGTKQGLSVYPYTKIGNYYDFKGKNGIASYKGSTPYLYVSSHTGWKFCGNTSPIVDRGISIPINAENAFNIQISSIQLWMRYSKSKFNSTEVKIFSIFHKNGIYDFYIVSDSSTQRGKIFAKNKDTGAILNNVIYYVNGNYVDTPYITNEEWIILGVGFTDLLDFDKYTGHIDLNGPLLYNNIGYYLANNLQQNQKVEVRSWAKVKSDPSSIIWDFWQNSYTWQNTKIVSSTSIYDIDPSIIFNKYTGSDRVIIDDDIAGIHLGVDKVKLYGQLEWLSSVKVAV